jgi:type VI secretion system protein ImpK
MERIHEATKDAFNALIQLRNIGEDSYVAPEMVHQRMVGFFDDLFRKGQQLGLPERDVQDIVYAMVALADELALRSSAGVRDVWMSRPLQLHYFNENLAGEGFFQRLEMLLADPSRAEALRVYYYCLQFGFQGRYAIRGGELELAAVTRRVQDTMGHLLRPERLSVHPGRPKERVTRRAPGYITIWLGLFAVLFSVAIIIILRTALDRQTHKVVDRIDALLSL